MDRRRILKQLAIAFGAWTVIALLSYVRIPLQAHATGRSLPPGFAAHALVSCWLWALLTPAILALATRFPLERGRRARNAAIHAAAALLSIALSEPPTWLLLSLLRSPHIFPSLWVEVVAESFIDVFSYAAIVALGHALVYHRLSTEERLRRSELEARLLEARMAALEARLHPHFLFNALNTIASLIRTGDTRLAVRSVARLGDLMRSLLLEDGQEVPLAQELDFVERYLELEQARFGARLSTRIDADAAVLNALVPRLLLQPLVENALRHGIEPSPEPGRVEIRAARSGRMLELTVRDTGDGHGNGAPSTCIGLANTRARLLQLYGDRQELALSHGGAGTVARVTIPFRAGET